MKNVFRFSNLRLFSALLALILALPVSRNGLAGFYSWLSPFIMLNSVLVLKSFVWLNIVSVPVIIIAVFRKRWFCHNLCPVGYYCDLVSGQGTRSPLSHRRLPDISRLLAVISLAAAAAGLPIFIISDPLAIFNGFFSVFSGDLKLAAIVSLAGFPLLLLISFFFPGIWCTKLCPLGGLQLVISDLNHQVKRIFTNRAVEPKSNDSGRRYFIMTGAGIVAGSVIPRILKPPACNVIRPPASVEASLFNSLCCRCGCCSKACPTGIITPQTDFTSPFSWMTPEISFKSGYCLETCSRCSQVCPSGAITLFDVRAKNRLFMGTAEADLENCLVVNNRECVRCVESCKYDAIKFVSGHSVLNVIPVVLNQKCVGCGACEVVCPKSCIVIKPVARS